jgi:MFS family permease
MTRWSNLAMCMLVIVSGGTVYSFGAYSSALKEKLSLTQEQLEIAALCSNLGNYIGLAGFFYDRFGAATSVRFGAGLIGAGYGAQWLLMKRGAALGPALAAPLLCVCCFVWGHGSGYLDVAAIGTGVAAFPRQRGAVVGLLKSLYGLASSLIVLFAAYWSSEETFVGILALIALGLPLVATLGLDVGGPNEAAEDGGEDDASASKALDAASLRIVGLAAAALTLAVLRIVAPTLFSSLGANVAVSVVVALGLAYQTRVAAGPAKAPAFAPLESRNPLADEEPGDEERAPSLNRGAKRTSLAGTLESPPRATAVRPELWLFLAAILPGAGMGLMTINNLGQIVSARRGNLAMQEACTTLVSIANCLGRLACGRVADSLVARGTPRPALMVAADLAGCLSMLFLYASGESVGAALAGAACAGFAYGMIWTLIPTLASDLFGRESFGSNYMLCLPAVIAGSILFSTLLAPAVYAANASTDDDDDAVGCVGAACFGDTFLATAAACLVGAAAAAGLLVKSRRLYELQ